MKFTPHEYQRYAIEFIKTHEEAAVLLDMGLGKTVITLTAIADLMFDERGGGHGDGAAGGASAAV